MFFNQLRVFQTTCLIFVQLLLLRNEGGKKYFFQEHFSSISVKDCRDLMQEDSMLKKARGFLIGATHFVRSTEKVGMKILYTLAHVSL